MESRILPYWAPSLKHLLSFPKHFFLNRINCIEKKYKREVEVSFQSQWWLQTKKVTHCFKVNLPLKIQFSFSPNCVHVNWFIWWQNKIHCCIIHSSSLELNINIVQLQWNINLPKSWNNVVASKHKFEITRMLR